MYDNFKNDLLNWALSNNITSVAMDGLLKICRDNLPEISLPLSSKTMLKTPNTYNIVHIGGGSYYHFGLKIQLMRLLNAQITATERTLNIILGIDGLPISKSSKAQFWPILGICQNLNKQPFIIGLYFSERSKPLSIHEFLSCFTEEFHSLYLNGLLFNNLKYNIRLQCLVADAPARNYIKCSVAFNAYSGCDRCVQKGKWLNRVTFNDNHAVLRTDLDFINQSDKSHHVGVSPLLGLGLRLVSDVVLDYMHLICLGVVKKMLVCWKRGPLKHREGKRFQISVSEKLVNFRKFVPSEFNRKQRSLFDLEYWKATEFRTFLLYLGPVALKGELGFEKYIHFLHLSLAIRILLSDNNTWYGFARSLLTTFVTNIPILYMPEFLIYNVHSLLHITDDAEKFGSLNNINAFAFENFMQSIKKMLRGKNRQLQQIIRRVHEYQEMFPEAILPEQNTINASQNLRDSGWMLKNGEIISIVKSEKMNCTISYRKYLFRKEFFTLLCSSTKFNIYEIKNLSPKVYSANRSELCELVILPLSESDEFVCFPIC